MAIFRGFGMVLDVAVAEPVGHVIGAAVARPQDGA